MSVGGAVDDGAVVVLVVFKLCFKFLVQTSMKSPSLAEFVLCLDDFCPRLVFKKRCLGPPWGGS